MPCDIPITTQNKVLHFAEKTLRIPLNLTRHILFPNSAFITSCTYCDDYSEDHFLLIFEIKINHCGTKVGNISYYQIPQRLRHKGLAKKVYYMLEDEFKNLGCEMVTVEATIEPGDYDHTTVPFWEHLNFSPLLTRNYNDDTCPMVKKL